MTGCWPASATHDSLVRALRSRLAVVLVAERLVALPDAGVRAVSPTARSLRRLRERGYLCQVVERFNPGARVRQDLFGFIDILAIKGGITLGVQACTVGDQSKRIAKIKAEPKAAAWLSGYARHIEVHGWGKHGPRGKRKTWDVTETSVVLSDLPIDSAGRAAGDGGEG